MENNGQFDIVIHNGNILTVNKDGDVIYDGVICIADGRLKRIEARHATSSLPAARETINAQGGLITPGLVNTHTHAPMALFRGLSDDVPLMTWLYDYMFKAEKRWLSRGNVFEATSLSCAEMLLSGTTTFCDGYFFEDAVAEAVTESGMRAVLGQGIVDFPAPGVPDPAENVNHARRFIEKWRGRNALIRPGLFCHSPYTCSRRTLTEARRVADETGSLFQIHVAETKSEWDQIHEESSLSPVQYLDSLGVLNENTLAVHVIWVDDADMDILAEKKVGVSITTESEMKLASGVAPVPAFLEKALRLGMGTDSCASNNNLDMFEEMDFMAKLHKVTGMDPELLGARQVFTLATRGGAEAIGLGDEIGSLEIGKKADVMIIDTNKPHLTPMYEPTSHLVYAAKGGDVNDVIVDGKVVVRNRTLLTIDPESVMEKIKQLAEKIESSL